MTTNIECVRFTEMNCFM